MPLGKKKRCLYVFSYAQIDHYRIFLPQIFRQRPVFSGLFMTQNVIFCIKIQVTIQAGEKLNKSF